jgi:hypothetical protein
MRTETTEKPKVEIKCVVCGARPYPELGPPGTREDFTLMRLDDQGRPADDGRWYCEAHFPKKGAPR